ncbi:MAG: TetR/AcrR family transcriptional regulator [Parvibaculum sp.]|uniref:TetR/AcrR family transcriptional regulator n=1 Tax=Parvibaculum sp. TaxID=2024848 RepID=UPI0025E1AF38|nr:TetR/AcrR family transcriptional regulator [Parvibaculum sp.]MCE9648232.1 TetR/AcrR family transcriptional regulator [Parvibaculum sp.]
MGQSQNTKERLLEAARGLFAERGYHNATVRDIAARAHTNLASINYYFRSKDDLYREVMRSSFRTPNGNGEAPHVADDHSPEERVRAFVHGLIPLSAEETGDRQWEIRPHLEAAQDAVRPFLPVNATTPEITAMALWLIGQCLIFSKLASGTSDGFHPIAFTPENTAELVELVVSLALRGLGA